MAAQVVPMLARMGLKVAVIDDLECRPELRSEEHTSELQSRETSSYAVFCLKKKNASFNAVTPHLSVILSKCLRC